MLEGKYNAIYKGKDNLLNFKNGKEYVINIKKLKYGYLITTEDKKLNISLTSENSIDYYFDII